MTITLAKLTTLGVGGPMKNYVHACTETAIIDAVCAADATGESLLLIGGGSNILPGDHEFKGTVVKVATKGYKVHSTNANGEVRIDVQAGHGWDDFVAFTIEEAYAGVEALSGIPGTVGATPIQNVGAYGQDVSQTIVQIRAWDRKEKKIVHFDNKQMKFTYRDSFFKHSRRGMSPRYVVLVVSFCLKRDAVSTPIRYAELAEELGIEQGEKTLTHLVRTHVLSLRARKGMVLDSQDRDTFSTGSFFTNPLVSQAQAQVLPENAPRYQAGQQVKLSAAWLISNAGFQKGYGLPGPASLSTKHALAITNRGNAKAEDIMKIAREVQAGVKDVFNIDLEPEAVLIDCLL